MMTALENKQVSNWEADMKLRGQVHMAVRLCTDTANLEEALRVLKTEHQARKVSRKKQLAQEPAED